MSSLGVDIKELRQLGQRRRQQRERDEALADEIRRAVEVARGDLSMTQIAEALGIDRSQLYRTYLK